MVRIHCGYFLVLIIVYRYEIIQMYKKEKTVKIKGAKKMKKSWLNQIKKYDMKEILSWLVAMIILMTFFVSCLNLINRFVPKAINYVFGSNTSSENLPTCSDSEKIIIGYRNGKPMKICDQTYTFIFQDWNYSCMLTANKDSGTLGFARGVGKTLGLSEKDAVATVNKNDSETSCNLGRLSPEFIQKWYSGKGDGSVLTHTKTLGF